jgi:hypothetical protein
MKLAVVYKLTDKEKLHAKSWNYFYRSKCVDNKIIIKWRVQISKLIGFPETSVTTNLRCVTSPEGEDLNNSSSLKTV